MDNASQAPFSAHFTANASNCDWYSVADEFLNSKESHCKPATVRYYRDQLRGIVSWAEDHNVGIAAFRPKDMDDYLVYRKERVDDGTRRKDCQVVKAFFRFAKQREFLRLNRFSDYPLVPVKRKIKVAANEEDLALLLKGIDRYYQPEFNAPMKHVAALRRTFYMRRFRALVYLLIETAARINEVLEIRLKDLDMKEGKILLRYTKTGKHRYVPCGAHSQWAITEYLKVRPHAASKDGDAHLLINCYGDKIDYRKQLLRLHEIERFAQIERPITFHSMRRYGATVLTRVGIKEAQDLLGHDSAATTSIYLTTTFDRVKAAHAEAAPLSKLFEKRRASVFGVERTQRPRLL